MKKHLSMLIAFAMILSTMAVPVSASDEISLVAFGNKVECDQPPVVVDGRTLVPLRAVAETVGAEVEWNDENRTVSIETGLIGLLITIGENQMTVNNKSDNSGIRVIPLDVSVQIINGRTMLPVRAVAEGLNLNVDWDADSKTVNVSAVNSDVNNIAFEENTEADTDEISETTTVSEASTETATAANVVIKSISKNDYTKNAKQKTVAEDKITADDVDLLTVKVLYDEVEGNSAYNQFMAETANNKIANYISKYRKEVEQKYNNLASDEKSGFDTYHIEVTYDVTYADDKVVSALYTPEEYIAGVNNVTGITALVTDAAGTKTLSIEELTDGKVSTAKAFDLALEKFNKKFQDSLASLQTTRKFQNIYFDFAVNGELTADKINFYLDSNGNYMFYADRGVVAPYSEGIIIACVTKDEINRL